MTEGEHMPSVTQEGGVPRRERSQVLRLFVMVVALMAGLAIALGAMLSAAQAAPFASLKQFRVPTDNSEPRSITNGSDGNRWFTLGTENVPSKIARITDAGVITEFGPACATCIVTNIIQGPDGILYFTSNEDILGRITTQGEFLAPIPMPDSAVLAGDLAVHDDDIWITDFNNDSLWRYDTTPPDTGFTQFPVPEPSDVAVDEAGIVWFAATSDRAIGRLDPETGNATLRQTALVPRGITVAADGDVWFSARFVPQGVGELDPETNDVREFPLTDNPGPQDIAASPDGPVWFTQTTKGNIARITDDGVITEGKVVKGSEPFGITVASNGNPWYTMMQANKIATLQLR